MSPLSSQQSVIERVAGSCCYLPVHLSPLWNLKVKVWASHWLAICRGIRKSLETMICRNGVWSEKYIEKVWRDVVNHFSEIVIAATDIIIISCLQRRSSIAQLDTPFLRCRLCSVSPRNVCSSSWYGSDRMWLRRTYSVCSHGSPTDVSLPGWQPVPSGILQLRRT